VPTLHTYDYAVIRVVPRVEREEFINVGVIVSCPGAKHLQAAIEIDPVRMQAFAPSLDVDALQPWLDAIVAICRGDACAFPFPHRQAQFGGADVEHARGADSRPARRGGASDAEDGAGDLMVACVVGSIMGWGFTHADCSGSAAVEPTVGRLLLPLR